jgi:uncharacterized protein
VPRRLAIAGPSGPLVALVSEPEDFAGARAAVVCHPHPLHGGTMDNKVVQTVARTLEELGFATVRFNFRGVGASAGVFDEGVGETDDARAVCDWVRAKWSPGELWLAGFSFGAHVAVRLATEESASPPTVTQPITRLITIAPPIQRFDSPAGLKVGCPWLMVQGDRDELVDVDAVRRWVAGAEPPPRLVVLAGVDHFFHGRLHELKDTLQAELATAGG